MPLISIIIPVYNVEDYLQQCVESILNQTFKDFELILVDDGSTDSSPTMCDNYSKKDSRVKVIHKSNEKQGAARNCGVQHAKADLVCFVDSDDYISENYLEHLYNVFKNNNSDIVCCNYVQSSKNYSFAKSTNEPKLSIINIDDTEMSKLYKAGNYFWVCWCKLIKKEILIQHPFPEGIYYEDNAIVFKWIFTSGKLTISDEILYYYRINKSGTTKGQNKHEVDYVKALQNQIVFFVDKHYTITAKLIFDEYLKLTTHLFFNKEKRTKEEAKFLKENVSNMLNKYGYLLSKDDIYGNRLKYPFLSYFIRIKRKLLKTHKK